MEILAGFTPVERVLMIIGFIFRNTGGYGRTASPIRISIRPSIRIGTNTIYWVRNLAGLKGPQTNLVSGGAGCSLVD